MGLAEKLEVGDYDLRGPDFETLLVGPITATIIDADRLVRAEWSNGFPNWALYRCVYAGDEHHGPWLRQWCVAFAVAYGESGGTRKPSDLLACVAGWDAYHALRNGRWIATGADVASAAGVTENTYRRFRGAVYARLKASLDEYWVRLQIGFRQAVLLEKRAEYTPSPSRYGVGSDTGNYIAMPRGSGC